MKLTRKGNAFFDENGAQVNWQDIQKATGLPRSESRLVMKKLAAEGADVPPEALLRWRDDQVLIWKLENELGTVLP